MVTMNEGEPVSCAPLVCECGATIFIRATPVERFSVDYVVCPSCGVIGWEWHIIPGAPRCRR